MFILNREKEIVKAMKRVRLRIEELLEERNISKNTIEQNRCAMACQGCGAVLFLLKSSGITFHNPLLLSYHTKQLN